MVIQIDMYEVDMESSLGGGNYGEVFKAHHRETKAAVAAKRILTTKIKNQKYIRGEIAALKAASGHPNIVSLLHHEQLGDVLWLIMDYCEAGNIHEYLTAHTVTDQQAAVIIQDCVEAVHHLHNLQPQGIMHRDLKPENLLVTVIDGQPRIKVCDFGVSVMLSDDIQSTTYCGTGYYLAPGFFNPDLKGIKYDKSIDLFALGLIIRSILHRQPLQGLEPPTDSNDPIGYGWWKRDRLGEDWTPYEARPEEGLLDILVVQMTSFRPKDRLSIHFVKDLMDITKQGEDWARFQTQLDDGILEKLVVHMTSLTAKEQPCNRIIKNLLGFWFSNVRNRDVIDQVVQTEKYEAQLDEKINHIKELKDELTFRDDTIQSLTSVLPINIVFAPPKINKVADMKAAGHFYLGFGDGCVIVERGNDLDKWSVDCDPKPHLKKVLSAKRPQDVGRDSFKCILDDGCIVMRRDDTMTHVYSKDLSQKLGQHEGDFGGLCAAIGDKVLYCKEDKPGKYKLHLYSIKLNRGWFSASSSHKPVSTLPIEVNDHLSVSVCGHHSGYIAVVDHSGRTLDIYSSPSQHVRRFQLPLIPRRRNAVTSVGDIIAIAGYGGLHLYNWAGTRLSEVTQQQLGITDTWIHGIGRAGDRLLLAAGEAYNTVSNLYVYDVCPDA